MKQRLEETMNEAKRHFNNYINARYLIVKFNSLFRNLYNTFMESRLNQQQISGGVKGQKIQNDILHMLKKNLEV
jgi:hypothetical protein